MILISAEQTKKLGEGLVNIFEMPAVTYEQKPDGSCERVSVTVTSVNRKQFVALATLVNDNPTEEMTIKRSGEKVHIGFLPGKAKK